MTAELDAVLTHRFDGVDISEREFDRLLEAATWKRPPEFVRRGRVARRDLDPPATVRADPAHVLRVAKLKGVGVYDPASLGQYRDRILESFSDLPRPPTTIPLQTFVSYPHVGFTDGGDYTIAYGAVAPIGGIVHGRAVREYESAARLLRHSVPTIVPLAVIEYPDLRFLDQPMGAVITLSTEPAPYRLSEVQYLAAVQPGADPAADSYYEAVCRSLGVDGDPRTEEVRLRVICLLGRRIGRLVHDFSAAGLYRYSSEWSNFEYSFERDEVFLTDLDSVLELGHLGHELQTLQVLRDLGTLAYRLVSKFGTPTALGRYTIGNLLAADPLAETLAGYFPHACPGELAPISRRLWAAFVPHLALLNKHRKEVRDGWSSERRRSYKMDHDLFYVLAITSLFPLFRRSGLFLRYPSRLTVDDLLQKAERYLGDRFDYFLSLYGGVDPGAGTQAAEAERFSPDSRGRVDGCELRRAGDGKGDGVFATRSFRAGETVVVGPVEKMLCANNAHATQIGADMYALVGGLMSKVNHCCDPNCVSRISPHGTLDFVAWREIEAGDEITFDYAMRNDSIDNFPARCSCGSSACRGRITGWKDLPADLKEAYRPYAPPYLIDLDRRRAGTDQATPRSQPAARIAGSRP